MGPQLEEVRLRGLTGDQEPLASTTQSAAEGLDGLRTLSRWLVCSFQTANWYQKNA